jgi:hypothetical protein
MTTHTRTLLLAALLALSNLLWLAAYRSLDQAYMQESGLRDWAESLLREPWVCNTPPEASGEGNHHDHITVCTSAGPTAICKALPQPAPNR